MDSYAILVGACHDKTLLVMISRTMVYRTVDQGTPRRTVDKELVDKSVRVCTWSVLSKF